MQEIVDEFSKPGRLVVNLVSGTFATANACLKLSWHRCFVGCKVGAECFAASTAVLAETYARQVLTEKSDASGTDEVVHACKIVVRELDAFWTRQRMRRWKVSDGLCSVYILPLNITHFLSNMFLNSSQF